VGLVGTGKTTIAYSIAEALGRPLLVFLSEEWRSSGSSRTVQNAPEAEPGKVIKAVRDCKSRNPVILLDEIDRVTDQGRASIMGVLVELLDPNKIMPLPITT